MFLVAGILVVVFIMTVIFPVFEGTVLLFRTSVLELVVGGAYCFNGVYFSVGGGSGGYCAGCRGYGCYYVMLLWM